MQIRGGVLRVAASRLVAVSAAVGRPAVSATLCDRLAARAEALPPSAWAHGSKGLGADIRIEKLREPASPIERWLAGSPKVREAAIGDDHAHGLQIEHLPGTDLYLAAAIEGSLGCEYFALVRSRAAGSFSQIKPPPGLGSEDEFCGTQSADLARVLGAPVLLGHGAKSQADVDEDLLMAPWSGSGWGAPCRLDLRFRVTFKRTQRNCLDPATCRTLDDKVRDLAEVHHQRQKDRSKTPPYRMAASGQIPAEVLAAIKTRQGSTDTPDFPGSKPDDIGYSYEGLDYIPLSVNGRVLLAAIGHAGVGWREGTTTLIAVYDVQGGRLIPKAGWAFERSIAGLASARAH